jgi:hydroxymethylglutaryl-CoA lyase
MTLRYVECPRDSWQGFSRMIPVEEKQTYLRALLAVGFCHLDLGSFVSPQAVPQMRDTEEVLGGLERPEGAAFLCIVANERGLERALHVTSVSSVGYPLSVNDTFQRRNTGRSLADSWPLVERLKERAEEGGLRLVVYLSMGFGNPYGDSWSPEETAGAVSRLRELGIHDVALADTVGTATPERLQSVLEAIHEPQTLGLHLHARRDAWQAQLEVALSYGLNWFEGALGGIGGCPFAADELVGNPPSEQVLPWLRTKGLDAGVEPSALPELSQRATRLKQSFGQG